MKWFAQRWAPAGSDGQVSTLARNFGLLAAAGELVVELDVLPWTPGEATRAVETCLRAVLQRRGAGLGRAADHAAIEQVRSFLERHGEARFQSIDAKPGAPPVRDRAGFRQRHDDGCDYFILPGAWREEVCKGLDPGAAAKALDKAGCLGRDPKDKKHLTRSKRLPGFPGKKRAYHVTSRIFEIENDSGDEQAPAGTDGGDTPVHGGGTGGTIAPDRACGVASRRYHSGTTEAEPVVVPADAPKTAPTQGIPLAGSAGTTGTTGTTTDGWFESHGPARLPPSWSDPSVLPSPGSVCARCRGAAWWTEREDRKGWRCSRCHPPTGQAPGDVHEVSTR